jgi:hypothetical protein
MEEKKYGLLEWLFGVVISFEKTEYDFYVIIFWKKFTFADISKSTSSDPPTSLNMYFLILK